MNNYEDIILDKMKWLNSLIVTFIEQLDGDNRSISISLPILVEIIDEVQREEEMFTKFHEIIYMSRPRIISLYCYYILKRKPLIRECKIKCVN